MVNKSDERPVPVCLLAHEIINRLSVNIGNSGLVREKTTDSDCAKRLLSIRESARNLVVELNRHQCELNRLLRTTVMEKGKFLI